MTRSAQVRVERGRSKLRSFKFKMIHQLDNTNPLDYSSRHPPYGGPENTKLRYELADKLTPFLWGYTKKHPKFKIPCWLGSAASRLAKYTKEILKNTKEKSGKRIFKFLALKTIL